MRSTMVCRKLCFRLRIVPPRGGSALLPLFFVRRLLRPSAENWETDFADPVKSVAVQETLTRIGVTQKLDLGEI